MRLKGRIVQSPERMRREMTEVAAALDREREMVAVADRNFQTFSGAIQLFEGHKQDVTKAVRQAEELVRDVARTKQAEESLEEVRENADRAQRKVQDVTNREQRALQLQTSAKQRQTRLVQKHEMKRATAAQGMEERQRDLTAVRADYDTTRGRGAQMDVARADHTQKKTSKQRKHEQDLNATRGELRRLMSQVATYQAELVAAARE